MAEYLCFLMAPTNTLSEVLRKMIIHTFEVNPPSKRTQLNYGSYSKVIQYGIRYKGNFFGGYRRQACLNFIKLFGKVSESMALVVATCVAAWFAGASYFETKDKDIQEQKEKSLEMQIRQQEETIKEISNQLELYKKKEKILMKDSAQIK